MQVDDDAFMRKQAQHVVEHAVKIAPQTSQPAWAALLQLLALLEDFALHLIQVKASCTLAVNNLVDSRKKTSKIGCKQHFANNSSCLTFRVTRQSRLLSHHA